LLYHNQIKNEEGTNGKTKKNPPEEKTTNMPVVFLSIRYVMISSLSHKSKPSAGLAKKPSLAFLDLNMD
ncbi:MAG: hypothetical protein WCR28_03800, partial [Candidatus Izemoplasmatales bacterium]